MSSYEYPKILYIDPIIGLIKEISYDKFCVVIQSISIDGDDVKLFLYFINSGQNNVGKVIRKRCSCCFEINLEFDELNSATICETIRSEFLQIFNYVFLPEVYNNIEKLFYDNIYIPKCALMQ